MVSPRHVDRLLFAAAFLVCGLAAHAQLYTDTQALHAPTTTASEYYGYYVAASGNLVAAGTTSNRRIHISERTASGWVHRATIAAGFPDNDPGAIALDGTTLVAGNEIFVRGLDGNWALQARLPPRIGNPALRGDLLAVGVASEGSPPDANEDGSVYIYQRSGSTWTQQARLMPDTTGMRELLGENVELEGDTVVAAGRAMPDGAYVFARSGTTWARQARLRAPTGAGWLTVALDGNFAAVGDPGNNQVHLFERSGTTWRLTQSLPRPGTGGTFFGKALAYDGGILAVGAETWTYLYARTAAGLVLMQSIRRDGNLFGTVTLSNNGKAFFLSDPFDDTRASAAGIVEAFDTPPAAAVQAWTARDVGVTGVAGSASLTGTTRSISGSGADIWNRADGLHFAATSLTGDGAIIARLSSLQTGNSWAKFGLMLREDFSAAAKNVMALVTPGGRIGVQARASTAELTTFRDAGTQALPVWLMLTRAGNTIAAFRSADGDNWIALGSVSMALPATVLVGYAITSHDNTRLITGQLDGLELVSMNEPPPPPPTATPPAAPANLNGALAGPQSVSLTWTDAATNENGFVVERSIASTGSYAAIVTLPANATSHVDSGLSASTAYTYRLRAFRDDSGGRLYSAYSNTFTIATQSGSQSSASGQDIGNVGVAGSSSASGGVITIRGGGADIWGAADAFHFYQQTVSGDFDLRARVRSLTATHAWAKAGVMVRESLDARARNVFALLTAGNAAGLQSRDVFGGGTSFTAGPWNRAPYWVRLVRTGNTFQGFTSPDGNNWTAVGTRTLALPAQLHAGIAVTSHDATRVTEAIVESFSLGGSTQPPPPPPPPPPPAGTWTDRVLGTGTGSVAIDDVDIDIVARGADIWGANDSGYFVYRTWRGDGEIVARIDSMSAGHAWSKAGLMMRASLAPNSANALVNVTPTNGATFQVRPLDGAATELVQHVRGPRAPAWLRLTRRGSIISAAHSIDGANWVSIGSRNLTAAEEIYVGFAVSSHDLAASTRAVFSAFQVR